MDGIYERRLKWAAALRSGEYTQTTGILGWERPGHREHCCLGVACELYAKEHPEFPITMKDDEETILYDQSAGMLPVEVANWLGITQWGDLEGNTESLADRNDRGASFDHIADLIEKEGALVDINHE